VDLTTHINLISRVRVCEALPPLTPYAFMLWRLDPGIAILAFHSYLAFEC